MPNSSTENENLIIARAIQEKFEFYFLALVFTILGLSIQTIVIAAETWQIIPEILAFALLAISAFAGLSRVEWTSVLFRQFRSRSQEKANLMMLKQGASGRPIINEEGEQWVENDLNDAVSKLQKNLTKRDEIIKSLETKHGVKYEVHKWGFYFGIVSLLISRVWFHIISR